MAVDHLPGVQWPRVLTDVWGPCAGHLLSVDLSSYWSRRDLSYILHYLCDFQWHFSAGTGVVLLYSMYLLYKRGWMQHTVFLVCIIRWSWLSCGATRIFPPKIKNWFRHPPANATDGAGWQTPPPVLSQMPANQEEQRFPLPRII